MTIATPLLLKILSPDMLTAAGLQILLTGTDFQVQTEEDAAVDALLIDMGQHGNIPDALDPNLPILALAEDEDAARTALSSGATGVLSRQGDPMRIPAALTAIGRGLQVIDPVFLGSVFNQSKDTPKIESNLGGREVEVLELAATGMSNKDIAQKLFISVHTVKFHFQSSLKKLSAKNRTEAVVRAGKLGLI